MDVSTAHGGRTWPLPIRGGLEDGFGFKKGAIMCEGERLTGTDSPYQSWGCGGRWGSLLFWDWVDLEIHPEIQGQHAFPGKVGVEVEGV